MAAEIDTSSGKREPTKNTKQTEINVDKTSL